MPVFTCFVICGHRKMCLSLGQVVSKIYLYKLNFSLSWTSLSSDRGFVPPWHICGILSSKLSMAVHKHAIINKPVQVEGENRAFNKSLFDHILKYWSDTIHWYCLISHSKNPIKFGSHKCNTRLTCCFSKCLVLISQTSHLLKLEKKKKINTLRLYYPKLTFSHPCIWHSPMTCQFFQKAPYSTLQPGLLTAIRMSDYNSYFIESTLKGNISM